MSNYPDGLSGWAICQIEGCNGPNCRRCGKVNYPWLGYMGAIARWSKAWGITSEETGHRFAEKYVEVTP